QLVLYGERLVEREQRLVPSAELLEHGTPALMTGGNFATVLGIRKLGGQILEKRQGLVIGGQRVIQSAHTVEKAAPGTVAPTQIIPVIGLRGELADQFLAGGDRLVVSGQ